MPSPDLKPPVPSLSDPGRESFRQGFIAGWYECVFDAEKDKEKLMRIAEVNAEKYLKDPASFELR